MTWSTSMIWKSYIPEIEIHRKEKIAGMDEFSSTVANRRNYAAHGWLKAARLYNITCNTTDCIRVSNYEDGKSPL